MATATTKRTGTRSQASINDFFKPIASDQSPLKAARRAARTKSGPGDGPATDAPSTSQTIPTAPSSLPSLQNDNLRSSTSRKRSSTPDADPTSTGERSGEDERQMKRPRIDGSLALPERRVEDIPLAATAKAIFGASGPTFSRTNSSIHSPTKSAPNLIVEGSPSRRSRSVPPVPSPSKVVDLRSLSPSRSREPTASPERQLRFTSVPPTFEPTREDAREHDSMDVDPFVVPPTSSEPSSLSPKTPPSPPHAPQLSDKPEDDESEQTAHRSSHLSLDSPPSPLTPVPPTPNPRRLPMQSALEDLWASRPKKRGETPTTPRAPSVPPIDWAKGRTQAHDLEHDKTPVVVPSYFAFPESSPESTPGRGVNKTDSVVASSPPPPPPDPPEENSTVHEPLPIHRPTQSFIPVPSSSARLPARPPSSASSLTSVTDDDGGDDDPAPPPPESTRARQTRPAAKARTVGAKAKERAVGKPHMTRSMSKRPGPAVDKGKGKEKVAPVPKKAGAVLAAEKTVLPAKRPSLASGLKKYAIVSDSKKADATPTRMSTASATADEKTPTPGPHRPSRINLMKMSGGRPSPKLQELAQTQLLSASLPSPSVPLLRSGLEHKGKGRAFDLLEAFNMKPEKHERPEVQEAPSEDDDMLGKEEVEEVSLADVVESSVVEEPSEIEMQEPVAGPSTSSTAATGPFKPRPSASTFNAPTASSRSKVTPKPPPSPTKRPLPPTRLTTSSIPRPQGPSTAAPPSSSKPAHSRFNSLSDLSDALDRLRSRPGTSLGFNPDDPREREAAEDERRPKDDSHIIGRSNSGILMPPPKVGPAKPIAPPSPKHNTFTGLGRGRPSVPPARPVVRGSGPLKQSKLSFGRPPAPRTAGFAPKRVHAAQKSTLPVIAGSPVKPGGPSGSAAEPMEESEDPEQIPRLTFDSKGKGRAPDSDMGADVDTPMDPVAPMDLSSAVEDDDDVELGAALTLEPRSELEVWRNASRRASMASQRLNEEIAAGAPETPPPRRGAGESTDSSPSERARSLRSGGLPPPRPADANGKPRSLKLKVLKACTVFVDVRTEDGDDAGGLFVQMLKNMGAKVLGRLAPSCTHVVCKNALSTTFARWRSLAEPRPKVVTIAWIVQCVEQKAHVDERKFLAPTDENVLAGLHKPKRRRSMMPKYVQSPQTPTSAGQSVPADGGDSLPLPPGNGTPSSADQSMDSEGASFSELVDLAPLERARLLRRVESTG